MVEGGYVVTNAHVVWPFQEVRVVFPDGSEYLNSPVLNWDLLGDLAVIGPLQTSIVPLALVDGEDLTIGSDVFLTGYTAEAEQFPQPAISRGLISRLREWERIEMTYFQTDAAVAGGQSGGVLVSEDGEVIGITGLFLGEIQFGLVASAADVLPRVRRLIAGEDVAGLGDRSVPLEGGQLEYQVILDNLWDARVYVINEAPRTKIDISMQAENDATFDIRDMFGNALIAVDSGVTGTEFGSLITEFDLPYFLRIYQYSEETGDLNVRSTSSLASYHHADDGISITIGQTVLASMDHPADFDYFVIDITVDSVMIDPYLRVDYLGATEGQIVTDDDSGGGIFGLNSKITYQAPHSSSYFIIVNDANFSGVGVYFLTVSQAPPGAIPTLTVQGLTPPPTVVESPFGPMALYESALYPFTVQYPSQWKAQPIIPELSQVGIKAYFVSDEREEFLIGEEDTVALGLGEVTLEEYVDIVLSVIESTSPGFQLVSREQILTSQGLPAEVLEVTIFGGFFKGSRLIYLHEGKIGFSATYVAPKDRYKELKPLIDYSFRTFQVQGAEPSVGKAVKGDALVLATSKNGTLWKPRDQVLDGGLVSSLRALL